jgi:hypothetical protein
VLDIIDLEAQDWLPYFIGWQHAAAFRHRTYQVFSFGPWVVEAPGEKAAVFW